MYRFANQQMMRWKSAKNRTPLLIRGARQVGKTWLVREHGKTYGHYVEINLEAQPELLAPFRRHFGNPVELIKVLSQMAGQKISPDGNTILFIDEIQESSEALLSLRYFRENLPRMPVVAAGSLLEFAFAELSFPVGRIDFLHLFPLNFEEFLLAKGRKDMVDAIHDLSVSALDDSVHDLLLREVGQYCLLGGLPEVVRTHVEGGDLTDCQTVQQRLVVNYREDFHKYAGKARIEDLRQVFAGIPLLLGRKFKYSDIDPHAKSRDLSSALNLLVMAGLAYKACHSSANGLPLAAQIKPNKFKVYFVDTGLALRILGLHLTPSPTELANRGAVAEQFVAQEIISGTPHNQTPALYYWHRENRSAQAEVDLLAEKDGHVVPIEVKSAKGTGLKSLHLFLKEKADTVKTAWRFSALPYGANGKIVSYPLYAVSAAMLRESAITNGELIIP